MLSPASIRTSTRRFSMPRAIAAAVAVAMLVVVGFAVADAPPADAQADPVWTLQNVVHGGYLRQADGSNNVEMSSINDARSQWRVTTGAQGTVFRNVATSRYLDADGVADGGNVDTSMSVGVDDYWAVTDNGGAGLTIRNNELDGYIDGDGIGVNVDRSTGVGADDYWTRIIVSPGGPTPTPTETPTPDPNFPSPSDASVTFGTLGDWGVTGSGAVAVRDLMVELDPDIVVTMGDNRYGNRSFDSTVGMYCAWLKDAGPGPVCPSGGASPINRFFPSTGNHDYTDGGGISEYQNHLTIPGAGIPVVNPTGTELYYDFIWGPVHFFTIDSQAFRNSSSSRAAQTAWLQGALQGSTSTWQVVFLHHAPYSSSSNHGDDPVMQLSYGAWGADLVLAGHDHTYERIELDTTYVVNGLGGNSPYGLGSPTDGSVIRYNDANGLALFSATETQLSGAFHSIDANDGIVDSFVINAPGPFACSSDAGVLTWSDDQKPKYWAYKSTDGGASFDWIGRTQGDPAATTFTDPSPSVGAKYQVHYAGIDRVDCSISSEPDAGNGPFVCDAAAGALTWSDHDQPKYWIYKSTDGGATFNWLGRTQGSPAATTFTDPAPSIGAKYQVHYAGLPRVGCTILSEPGAGNGPFACSANGGQVSWSNHGQPKYWVYRSVNGGATYSWIGRTQGAPAATSFTDPAPVAGALYQVHYDGIPRINCS